MPSSASRTRAIAGACASLHTARLPRGWRMTSRRGGDGPPRPRRSSVAAPADQTDLRARSRSTSTRCRPAGTCRRGRNGRPRPRARRAPTAGRGARCRGRQQGRAMRRDGSRVPPARLARQARAPARRVFPRGWRPQVWQVSLDLGDATAKPGDDRFQRFVKKIDVAGEPRNPAYEQILQRRIKPELDRVRHRTVQRVDGGVERFQPETIACHGVGGGDEGRLGVGRLREARDGRRTAVIDDGVGKLGGDDLPAQRMPGDRRGKPLAQQRRKICPEFAPEVGVVGRRARQQPIVQRKFGVSEQDSDLRARQRLATTEALGQ